MYCLRHRIAAIALVLLGVGPALAQTQTGTITGRIVDLQTGEPIAKAAVSITDVNKTATTATPTIATTSSRTWAPSRRHTRSRDLAKVRSRSCLPPDLPWSFSQ